MYGQHLLTLAHSSMNEQHVKPDRNLHITDTQ